MFNRNSSNSISNNRIILLVGFYVFFLLILVLLIYKSIVSNSDYFLRISEKNKIRDVYLPSSRGIIYDRNLEQLVENKPVYEINITENNKSKETEVVEALNYFSISDRQKNRILRKVRNSYGIPLVNLINNATFKDISLFETISYKFTSLEVNKITFRNYLYPSLFSHIIGYVSNPDAKTVEMEKNKNKKLLMLSPNYYVGRSGIENMYNTILTGQPTYRKIEVNALNQIIGEIFTEQGKNGKDIRLTLDLELQKLVEKKIKDNSGSVILMDVKSGEILSMYSSPSFDTNKLNNVIDADYWNSLTNNRFKPLINKAISSTYPPGSTFKLITAIAALENGFDPNKTINCRGSVVLNSKRTLHCWRGHGHGKLENITEAIKHSCNIYLSEVGVFAGIENIHKTATKFGFGEKFNLELKDVNSGIVPNREWKRKRYNDVWVVGDTINVSIGQGFLTATPLELVVMTARIANGGFPVKPFIIYNSPTRDYNNSLLSSDPITSKEILDIVKEGMYKVVNEKGGTAYPFRIKDKKFEMAGKTGTTQLISRETMDGFIKNNDEQRTTRFRHHGLFVAFAPYDDPKYAIVVVIEHGNSGSNGAPIARDILEYAVENIK
ncbi:MAG: penicillin-binding protein 2 [Rickettsiales bacterium]|nr:penicillin-binding protein 2 [Rickettsiales bacterium]